MHRYLRRALSLFLYVVLELLLVVGLPLWLLLAVLVDLPRRARWVTVRLLCFAIVYLGSQLYALGHAFLLQIRHQLLRQWTRDRYLEENYALQRWWTQTLFACMCRLFRLRFAVQGHETLARGPYLLLCQHTSIVDTLVPSAFAANPFGIHVRYIMKSELRVDPALDIMGDRLPNYFVNRRSRDTGAELSSIRALAQELGARDAVVIWPEGTRWTPGKWRHVIQQLREKNADPALIARAEAMPHVMPPRTGGVTALLDGAPQADVVFCAHRGLEGFATVGDILSGGLVGSTVHVQLWRVPRSAIPAGREAQALWLFNEWKRVDAHAAAVGEAGAKVAAGAQTSVAEAAAAAAAATRRAAGDGASSSRL